MLKRLGILAGVALLSVGMAGQPHKAPEQKQAASQVAKAVPIGTDAANIGNHHQTDQPKASGNSSSGNASLERSHWWTDPNWWLVIVAALTGIVIGWQSRETRRAAQSAERQIGLQSIAMSQWVNIEPIKTVTPPAFQNPSEVVLEFQVLNKTDYLLTVKKIEAEVFYGGKARIFKVSGSDPVPPEKSSADGGLPFFLILLANRSTWSDSGAMFFVGGEVTYLDCMDIERTQEFRDMFHGYEDGRLVRKKSSGQVPEVEDYETKDEDSKTSDSKHTWFSWVARKLRRASKPN